MIDQIISMEDNIKISLILTEITVYETLIGVIQCQTPKSVIINFSTLGVFIKVIFDNLKSAEMLKNVKA